MYCLYAKKIDKMRLDFGCARNLTDFPIRIIPQIMKRYFTELRQVKIRNGMYRLQRAISP
jgi:hypothetical protein